MWDAVLVVDGRSPQRKKGEEFDMCSLDSDDVSVPQLTPFLRWGPTLTLWARITPLWTRKVQTWRESMSVCSRLGLRSMQVLNACHKFKMAFDAIAMPLGTRKYDISQAELCGWLIYLEITSKPFRSSVPPKTKYSGNSVVRSSELSGCPVVLNKIHVNISAPIFAPETRVSLK